MPSITTLATPLQTLLTTTAEALARQTGGVQRRRKFSGATLLQTLVLGLMTVLVFSLGFASVLVAVGLIAAQAGRLVLDRIDLRWNGWLQLVTSALVVVVGIVMTANAAGSFALSR